MYQTTRMDYAIAAGVAASLLSGAYWTIRHQIPAENRVSLVAKSLLSGGVTAIVPALIEYAYVSSEDILKMVIRWGCVTLLLAMPYLVLAASREMQKNKTDPVESFAEPGRNSTVNGDKV